MRTNRAAHRVALAVTSGAPIFELAVPCEVFGINRPDLTDPWYEFRVCGTQPAITVAAGFVTADACGMAELATADTVVVPGCASVHTDPPADLVEAVRTAYHSGARIAGICSGAFVLAAAGLLDGRRATTHWMHATELARRWERVTVDPAVLYLEDDGIHTSAGTAAGIDLCLDLVRRDHGTTVANTLARRLVAPPHRDGGQAQYIDPVPTREHPNLAALLDWARDHLDQPLSLDDLAAAGHVSRRTLARRFEATLGQTPLQWLQHERIRRAQQLLETTTWTIEHIAAQTGHGSAANLRRRFARHVATSPANYRQTFGQPAQRLDNTRS